MAASYSCGGEMGLGEGRFLLLSPSCLGFQEEDAKKAVCIAFSVSSGDEHKLMHSADMVLNPYPLVNGKTFKH